jgi:hypothetical protein
MCTLRVYWLVNRLSQPKMRQGNRLRASFSAGRDGEVSLAFGDLFFSTAFALEQEGVEIFDLDCFGECLRGGVEGNSTGDDDDGNSRGGGVE